MRLTFIVLFIAVGLAIVATLASANGGQHGACESGVLSIEGSQDLVSYNASPGIVTGVCLKAGNTQQHVLYVVDLTNECYSIAGIGTSTVTVTRLGEGRECQGISHIDVLIEAPAATPTPTPPTLTPTPTPASTPTPIPVSIATPTPEPVGSSTSQPASFPDTGGEPAGLPRAGVGP